jgi:hypothetical protein
MKKYLYYVTAALLLAGCTDVARSKIAAYGESAEVTCYSGGVVIYSGMSSGKVISPENSDGWDLRDSKTGKLIRVTGDCVVKN